MKVVPYDLDAAVEEGQRTRDAADVCVSFNGGAWRGAFWLGVVEQLQAQFPAETLASWKFCGTSAGACYALALAMDFPHAELKKLLCEAAAKARSHTLGVAFRVNTITGQIILDMLASMEEDELLRRLRGRFALCFTGLSCRGCCAMRPYLAYDFESKAEIFKACISSSNIPFFSSLTNFPRLGGVRAIDGGLTPEGCVPLLPSRCIVYGRCFGMPDKPLPSGVSLDIVQRPPVSTMECFHTPASDAEVAETAGKGRVLAAAFFASDEWANRYAAAQRGNAATAMTYDTLW